MSLPGVFSMIGLPILSDLATFKYLFCPYLYLERVGVGEGLSHSLCVGKSKTQTYY